MNLAPMKTEGESYPRDPDYLARLSALKQAHDSIALTSRPQNPVSESGEGDGMTEAMEIAPGKWRAVFNETGIHPTEFSVLIAPRAIEEKRGNIFLPEQTKEQEKWATIEGTLVACSPLAFSYATTAEWDASGGQKPIPGDRVLFAKYAGIHHKGKDGKEYIIAKDKDILAVLTD